jgi:hypothetical protein
MSEDTKLDDDTRVRTLEAEVRTLRQRVDQREQLLKVLNRRLLQLERGENGISGMERAETEDLLFQNRALQEENAKLNEQLGLARNELGLLRDTKLFRWASPARDMYARLRHLR